MAIYVCPCGFQETLMAGMRSHLAKNPSHGTGGTYGSGYRLVQVHIPVGGR